MKVLLTTPKKLKENNAGRNNLSGLVYLCLCCPNLNSIKR